jgi:hypothetical protein
MPNPKPLPMRPDATLDCWMSCGELAKTFVVDEDLLRKRLERFRAAGNDRDWHEVADRRARGFRYLYRLSAVRPLTKGPVAEAPN